MTLLPLRGAGIYSSVLLSIYINLTADSGRLPDNFSNNEHVYLSQGEKVARPASSASISPRGKDIFPSLALYIFSLCSSFHFKIEQIWKILTTLFGGVFLFQLFFDIQQEFRDFSSRSINCTISMACTRLSSIVPKGKKVTLYTSIRTN